MASFFHKPPVAKEQYLRYEAFSALAYGAKGINFWTYGMRENSIIKNETTQKDEVSEAYFSSLLNRRNKKTASWYYAQRINYEIQKYSDIFLKADIKTIEVMDIDSSTKPTIPIPSFNVTTQNEQGILLSKMISESITYYILVSKDPLDFQNISVSRGTGSLYELTPLKSTSLPSKLGNPVNELLFDRILPPGGYRIFRFES